MLQNVTARWQDYGGNKLNPVPAISKSDMVYFSVVRRKKFSFFQKIFLITVLSGVKGLEKNENWLAMLVSLFFVHLRTASLSQ
jgi:hypothetical protein